MQGNKDEATDNLEANIYSWRRWLTGIGAALVVAYFAYFGYMLDQLPAQDAEKWGQFGDFIGGLLNPLVAFAAFYWLTQSVKLQLIEMKGAHDALDKQATNSDIQVEISAQAAIVSALQYQIDVLDRKINLVDSENKILEEELAQQIENFSLYSDQLEPEDYQAGEYSLDLKRQKISARKIERAAEAVKLEAKKKEVDFYLTRLKNIVDSKSTEVEGPR